MRITCPICGRGWDLSEGRGVPRAVRCKACNLTFTPGGPREVGRSVYRPTPVRAYPAPYAPEPPSVAVNVAAPAEPKGNALAVASLVLGILAALGCWMPFLGLVSIPFAVLAVALGIPAMLSAHGRPAAIAGLSLAVLSVAVALSATKAGVDAVSKALEPPPRRDPAEAAPAPEDAPGPAVAIQGPPPPEQAPPAPAPAPQFPSVAGRWRQSPGPEIDFDISQDGASIVATFAYRLDDGSEVLAEFSGKIDRAGAVEGTLKHTKAPRDWKRIQHRRGQLSRDGRTIEGRAEWDGGGHEFTWTRAAAR